MAAGVSYIVTGLMPVDESLHGGVVAVEVLTGHGGILWRELHPDAPVACENLYQIAQQAERMTDSRYYRPMMRAVVQAFLYMIADVVNHRERDDENEGMSQKERLFKQFVSLLWASGGKNRKVDYFAQQLCITPKYLATLVRESSGKTPLEMIHRYTANMIAQRLRSTNMTIKEICTELEFPNESFFGRFVKKYLGCTPREYRNKMLRTSTN